MTRTITLILAAGVSLAALAGCSEDNAAEPADPPAATEAPAPETAPDETEDAMGDIREGAQSLAEGAKQLYEEGREAAGRALEDAGPTLEKAGEAAKEVGQAVDQIVRRAMSDFDSAVDELNRRIDEADGAQEPVSDDPATALAPADQLRADTKAAARAVPAGVGPDYVGVWAGDAADCKRIDQDAVTMFAVITPTTMRRYESVCNFTESAPMSEGTATVEAECIAEGSTENRQVTFTMPSEDELQIGRAGTQDPDAELLRCHLPQ